MEPRSGGRITAVGATHGSPPEGRDGVAAASRRRVIRAKRATKTEETGEIHAASGAMTSWNIFTMFIRAFVFSLKLSGLKVVLKGSLFSKSIGTMSPF